MSLLCCPAPVSCANLVDYWLGDITGVEEEQLEEHLLGCEDCSHRLQGIAAYAPLDQARFPPDAVIFRGNARQIMLISEAARRAQALEDSAVMGRPACAMLPPAM